MTNKLQSIPNFLIAMSIPFFIFTLSSCAKLIEAPIPSESLADANVYALDATAISVFNGIYSSMNENNQAFQGNQSIGLLAGLSADELTLDNEIPHVDVYYGYFSNSLLQSFGANSSGAENWSSLYNYIFRCNAAIEGLQQSNTLTPAVKQQLLGEAKFLRAFYYFYLTNLYGDVPLALTTDPEENTKLARSSQSHVYDQIMLDLLEAENLLSDDFVNGSLTGTTVERVRPTRWAAKALLSRVYLYSRKWDQAEAKASEVISNNILFALQPLNSVFLKNSQEAIWQLQPTVANFNTQEARTLVIPPSGPNAGPNPVFLSKNLLNSFEPGDQRSIYGNWIDTTIYATSETSWDTVAYAYKYKASSLNPDITRSSGAGTENMSEYFMMLRLAEQYLIRAEARAQQNKIAEAESDLNAIRNRVGLPNTNALDQASLLAAILKERRVELFTEWGHRWLDIKRTGKVDEVMTIITPQKSNGNTWHSYQQLYPLPLQSDLQWAPNLTQNPGY